MPSEPTGSEDDNGNDSESDLPDPSSGETFSDLDSLKETLSEGKTGTEESDSDSGGGKGGHAADADSGESDGSGGGSGTVRMTFHIDRETAERLRNAVYWTGAFVTLSGTARDALRAAVQRLEEQFNDGEPFPDRDEELKGGNPNLKK